MNELFCSVVEGEQLVLASGELECGGVKFVPDDGTAYMECFLAHAYPSVTYYGIAMDEGTVRASAASMLHKPVNISHLMKANDPENITRDRIIGSVVATELVNGKGGMNRLAASMKDASRIRCVMAIHKRAEGVATILGEHLSGKMPRTVSMEYEHDLRAGVFVVPAEAGIAGNLKHAAYNDAGLVLASIDHSQDLVALLPSKRGQPLARLKAGGKEHAVTLLAGGLNGRVNFGGIGLVHRGAEPTARIGGVMASEGVEEDLRFAQAAQCFAEALDLMERLGKSGGREKL